MAQRLRVLLVSSQASPFAKTGGLGDVAAALPRALRALGHDVRILMPRYRGVERHASAVRTVVPRLEVPVGDRLVEGALLVTETSAGVPVYFLQQDHYFDRDGLYGTADGDYPDNCERFVFFCRGALEALIALDGEGGTPGVRRSSTPTTGRPGSSPSTSARSTATTRRSIPSPRSSPSTTWPTRASSGTTTCP